MTHLVVDGGYREGRGGAGIVMVGENGLIRRSRSVAFACASSREAEARAVWAGSRWAAGHGAATCPVYSDNQDAIAFGVGLGIDVRYIAVRPGSKRNRGAVHRYAHRLATIGREHEPGWSQEYEGDADQRRRSTPQPPKRLLPLRAPRPEKWADPTMPWSNVRDPIGRLVPTRITTEPFPDADGFPAWWEREWWLRWHRTWREVALCFYYVCRGSLQVGRRQA